MNRLLLGCLILSTFGCGGAGRSNRETGMVHGSVTLDGEPLKSGTVCLTDDVDGAAALGEIGPDGTFHVKLGTRDHVPCGKYRVTVGPASQSADPMDLMKHPEKYKQKAIVPKKYQDRTTSELSTEVRPGDNELKLQLTGK